MPRCHGRLLPIESKEKTTEVRRTPGRGNAEEGGRGGQETRGCPALQEVEESTLPTTPCLWGCGSNKYIRHEKSEEPLETGSAFHKWKEKEQIRCYQAGLWRKHALHLRNLQPGAGEGWKRKNGGWLTEALCECLFKPAHTTLHKQQKEKWKDWASAPDAAELRGSKHVLPRKPATLGTSS